ncbi:MAG: aromatic ring-hydroxylating dioxygenase subunit alpha [Gammaproteobacteria bacterium]|nr:aromatic ring-hydroxylating dioxygenase subunit alpha [Gammaproteobacteria bacterium]MCP4090816.1 aromatic ring-hydroxylating dioxygenase subunit alpha [Gammaproteobacteria bacterium]MCP4277243.1 aromatic ring-hydroxylating dioxygenase subunit alpha [Gammaproteobacteria bacterium]MCP4832865.1 aromatic ring-hydroxylating dioxygenase subunit alpha [Gammaproteobacteria bacterium]MCP4928964.1 aromatic ring-hydroxylating dioxygenase subunit alpha [Gammaproteobacteria bacterium]
MNPKVGSWWPVVASNQLGRRPLGVTRFGEPLVFWRNGADVVCMSDRCPHRGAALSLGHVNKQAGSIVCPFHGLEFAADGRCTCIPVEQDTAIPADFAAASFPVREADGYIWVWRGPLPQGELPEVAIHPETQGMRHGDSSGNWNAHYTRCIENVCDFSHLPFVHKTTIGLFKKDWVIQINMQDVPGGFRARLVQDGKSAQSLEFLYPNRWLLRLAPRIMLGLVFAPIDETHTFVYGRTWYRLPLPGIQWLMNGYTRFSQFMVFREDWPIVASQIPGDVLTATDEKLLPSDAPVIAYRKLHHAHN